MDGRKTNFHDLTPNIKTIGMILKIWLNKRQGHSLVNELHYVELCACNGLKSGQNRKKVTLEGFV